MEKSLHEEIERINQITKYLIPKTIERDEDDIRNKSVSEKSYRGQTIKKDWLGTYSTNVNGNHFMSNKEWKVKDFIDKELGEE